MVQPQRGRLRVHRCRPMVHVGFRPSINPMNSGIEWWRG
jgi:hypothetical protein